MNPFCSFFKPNDLHIPSNVSNTNFTYGFFLGPKTFSKRNYDYWLIMFWVYPCYNVFSQWFRTLRKLEKNSSWSRELSSEWESERAYKQTSEQMSEWHITNILISRYPESLCIWNVLNLPKEKWPRKSSSSSTKKPRQNVLFYHFCWRCFMCPDTRTN